MLVFKEIMDDRVLQRLDKKSNEIPVLTYNYTFMGFAKKASQDLNVGDIVMVEQDFCVPADILLLSVPLQTAFVDSALIDG